MALTGTLREFGLVDLLSLVRVTRKSGVLSIRGQAEALDLYFRDGRLIRFTTSPEMPNLGQVLLRAGKVSQKQLDSIPPDLSSSEKAVAVALMEATGLSRSEILSLYAGQAGEAVGQAVMWSDGEFEFRPEADVGEDDVTFDLEVGAIIDRLRARQDQWRVLRSVLPHLEYSLRFPASRRLRVEPVVLGPAEWAVVTQVATSRTIEEIRQRLKLDDFQIRQSVQRLVSDGLIEIEKAREEHPPAPALPSAESDHHRREPAAVGGGASGATPRGRFLPRLFGKKRA